MAGDVGEVDVFGLAEGLFGGDALLVELLHEGCEGKIFNSTKKKETRFHLETLFVRTTISLCLRYHGIPSAVSHSSLSFL